MKKIFLTALLAALVAAPVALAQGLYTDRKGNPLPKEIKVGHERQKTRHEIQMPDIDGMKLLKCDFHIHTMFSDGVVWPSLRVEEAWEEGLDAIAITDHIEGQPARPGVMEGHNRSYEAAEAAARRRDIILIKGGEITRSMPPGHVNALFLENVDAIDKADPVEAIAEAHRQGAFLQWNHPGWGVDTIMWHPMHEELYKKGMLNGIEVFNEFEWYPVALDWVNDKNLTLLANTDVHDVIERLYDMPSAHHRPMTLVLAKERTPEAIKEALFDRRTMIYFYDTLMGREEYLRKFFQGAVTVSPVHDVEGQGRFVQISNSSDVPFNLSRVEATPAGFPASIDIPADGSITLKLPTQTVHGVPYEVKNLIISPRQKLTVNLF